MDDSHGTEPVSDVSQRFFEALRDPEYTNFAVLAATLDGQPVDLIVAINMDGDEYLVTPQALIIEDGRNSDVTRALLDRLRDPSGNLPEKVR